jgi:multiple sugar transport system permease protein
VAQSTALATPSAGRGGEPAPPGRPRRAPRRSLTLEAQGRRTGRILLAPALIVIAAVLLIPIGYALVGSFTDVKIFGGAITTGGFTLDNYTLVFGSDRWLHALLFTVLYAVVSVPLQTIMALVVALLLRQLTRGRGVVVAILLIPWAVITVAAGQLWAYIFNPNYGVITWILSTLAGHDVNVLATPMGATIAIFVADAWKHVPFLALILFSGLLMIDDQLYEAAAMDGAKAWRAFWNITVPQLTGALALTVLFRILQAFGLFDIPFVLTKGGPSLSTETLSMLGQTVLFTDLKIGPGLAIAISTGAIVLFVCFIATKVLRTDLGGDRG